MNEGDGKDGDHIAAGRGLRKGVTKSSDVREGAFVLAAIEVGIVQ